MFAALSMKHRSPAPLLSAHIAPGLWDEPISVPLLAPYSVRRESCEHMRGCFIGCFILGGGERGAMWFRSRREERRAVGA